MIYLLQHVVELLHHNETLVTGTELTEYFLCKETRICENMFCSSVITRPGSFFQPYA